MILVVFCLCFLLPTGLQLKVITDSSQAKRVAASTVFPGRVSWVGFEDILLVQNGSPRDETVVFKFQTLDGADVIRSYDVAPAGKVTVNIASVINAEGYRSVSVYCERGVKVSREMDLSPLAGALAALPNRGGAAARVGTTGLISSGSPIGNRVALTFDTEISDADPHTYLEATFVILDTLKAHGVKATFFVTGKFAEAYPELIIRMVYDGHDIANHSYDHPDFLPVSREQVATEVCWTEDLVKQITGTTTKPYFRFPGGKTDERLVGQLAELGYLCFHWSVDTADWTGVSAGALVSSVVGSARPGNIYLLHNVFPAQKAAALPTILEQLKARGFVPCSLTETLSM